MSNFEFEAMNKFTGTLPSTYRRYVDDTFLIFKNKTDVDSFFQHINNSHPNIKFTMETEHNETFPFFDILVIRQSDGTLTTQVYCKPKTVQNRTSQMFDTQSLAYLILF